MRWIGIREGALLAAVLSVALSALGWGWPLGVWWGLLAVAAPRGVASLLDRNLETGSSRLWTSIAAFGGQMLMAALALGGVAAGLPALAVIAGLGAAAFGVWARAWALSRAA